MEHFGDHLRSISGAGLVLIVFLVNCPFSMYAAETIEDKKLTILGLYSQLAIAARLQDFSGSRPDLPPDHPGLDIRLSDFRQGDFKTVAMTPIGELLSRPSDKIFLTMPGEWSFNGQRICSSLMVQGWRPSSARYSGVQSVDWNMPVAAMVRGLNIVEFITYTVTISYGAETKRYRAAALFGSVAGKLIPYVIDYVLDGSIVAKFIGEDFEKCLVRIVENASPIHKGGLDKALRPLRSSAKCTVDKTTKLCCDALNNKCLVEGHD